MANTYIRKTFSTTGTSRQKFTLSMWIKRGSGLGAEQMLCECYSGSSAKDEIWLQSNDTLNFVKTDGGGLATTTSAVFRDTFGWYNLVISADSTQGSNANRIKIYINGVQQTLGQQDTIPQNANFQFGASGAELTFGMRNATDWYFNGSMSHVHFCDGTAYDATAFGETDTTTGEWKAKTSPSVNYGTNGFLILKDGNTITDQSSNSNDFTLGGGTLTDLKDNPDNTFATIQFVGHPGNVTLNNGNLVLDGENENDWKKAFTSTLGTSSGKYYWEVKLGIDGESTTDYNITGIVRSDKTWTNSNVYSNGGFNGLQSANSAGGLGIYSQTGASMGSALYIGGSSVALTNGDIVMYAVDLDNKKMWVGKNGVWANAGSGGGVGNPSTGANELWGTGEFTTGAIYLPSSSIYYDNSQAYNFGNGYFKTTAVSSAGTPASTPGIFEYDCPTGFQPWSTKGLNA